MPRNTKFIAYGAIVAFAFMATVSALDDITRLLIVVALCACALAIEKLLRAALFSKV
jgi:hypothetical protein